MSLDSPQSHRFGSIFPFASFCNVWIFRVDLPRLVKSWFVFYVSFYKSLFFLHFLTYKVRGPALLPVGYMRSFFLETRSNAASALPASQTTIESKNWRNYIRKQRKANRGGTTLHAMYVPSRLGGKNGRRRGPSNWQKGFYYIAPSWPLVSVLFWWDRVDWGHGLCHPSLRRKIGSAPFCVRFACCKI